MAYIGLISVMLPEEFRCLCAVASLTVPSGCGGLLLRLWLRNKLKPPRKIDWNFAQTIAALVY
ncbi:MAG: hypothetical protein V7K36_33065 [Nostoc sp.]